MAKAATAIVKAFLVMGSPFLSLAPPLPENDGLCPTPDDGKNARGRH
jgi:hypothetical protein